MRNQVHIIFRQGSGFQLGVNAQKLETLAKELRDAQASGQVDKGGYIGVSVEGDYVVEFWHGTNNNK